MVCCAAMSPLLLLLLCSLVFNPSGGASWWYMDVDDAVWCGIDVESLMLNSPKPKSPSMACDRLWRCVLGLNGDAGVGLAW